MGRHEESGQPAARRDEARISNALHRDARATIRHAMNTALEGDEEARAVIGELRVKCLPLCLRYPEERHRLDRLYQESAGRKEEAPLSFLIGGAIFDLERAQVRLQAGEQASDKDDLPPFFGHVARALIARDVSFFRRVADIFDRSAKRAADDCSEAFWAHQVLGVYLNPNNEPTEQPGTKWAVKEQAMAQVAWENVFLRSKDQALRETLKINPKASGLPMYDAVTQARLDRELEQIRTHYQPVWKRVFHRAGLADLPAGNKGGRPKGKRTGFAGPQGEGA